MINQCFFWRGRHHIFQTNPGEQWAEGFVNADTVGLDMSPPFRAPRGQPHFKVAYRVSCPPVIRVIPGISLIYWYIDLPLIFPDASWTSYGMPKENGGLKHLQKNRANPNDFWNSMGPDNILFWGAFFLRDLTHTLIFYFLIFVLRPLHFIMFFFLPHLTLWQHTGFILDFLHLLCFLHSWEHIENRPFWGKARSAPGFLQKLRSKLPKPPSKEEGQAAMSGSDACLGSGSWTSHDIFFTVYIYFLNFIFHGTSGFETWRLLLRRSLQEMKKYGTAMAFSYSFLGTLNMCVMVAISWPLFIMRTGGSPILFSPLKLNPKYALYVTGWRFAFFSMGLHGAIGSWLNGRNEIVGSLAPRAYSWKKTLWQVSISPLVAAPLPSCLLHRSAWHLCLPSSCQHCRSGWSAPSGWRFFCWAFWWRPAMWWLYLCSLLWLV